MISKRMKEIIHHFFQEAEVSWLTALYDYNNGCFRGLIEIWSYFDRDYEGMTQAEAKQMEKKMITAFKNNDEKEFLLLLKQLPQELIENAVMQTVCGFEREHDEIDLSNEELEAFEEELHYLHQQVISGALSLKTYV